MFFTFFLPSRISTTFSEGIIILPTGIAQADFRDVDKKKAKKIPEFIQTDVDLKNKKILLYLGRISFEKNVSFLIEAVIKIMMKIPNIVLLIVGDGPGKEEMEQIVRLRNLENTIIFTGYIDRKMTKNVYAFADVFVFASKSETQGLVIIESMLCGTPVVAIGEMGIIDVMNKNRGGFMVKDDLNAFSQKTICLLEDNDLYEKKSREALDYSDEFTIDKSAAKMEKIYQSILR